MATTARPAHRPPTRSSSQVPARPAIRPALRLDARPNAPAVPAAGRRRRWPARAAGVVALTIGLVLPPLGAGVAGALPEPAPASLARPASVDPARLAPHRAEGSPGPAEPHLKAGRARHAWPTGARVPVVRAFDPPAQRWSAGHRGVDLRTVPGARVLASADGVVAFRGSVAGRPVISVDHADGVRTSYEPVASDLRAGQPVRAGDEIGVLVPDGRSAQAGAAEGLHPEGILHWGARRRVGADGATGGGSGHDSAGDGWMYIDPLTLLDPPVIRLLPV